MKQTAVEFLANSLKDFPHIKHSQKFKDLVEQAKEMEKEQIEEAFINGHKDGWNFGKGGTQQFFLSTIYYNETYGGNK